ncbi:hypothetical protein [uncultured Draconibacterium sp.]|uniref:hypothetical protein n=1 Tax=uncultured Draconibacterium sp. TaxID=1573823 RepID=UPI0029C64FAF|nr:hypothetical protein [uncultured Draconibacterium sp.]
MKWKDKLLSSSLPLEYEVGRILAKNDFCIDYDYSYRRLDGYSKNEFSVDIRAGRFNPFGIKSKDTILDIDFLIECKYRNPNVKWLFIPDINPDGFENISRKGILKVFDEFSQIHSSFGSAPILCDTCLKGMEVNVQNGETHETGIVHGLNQLLYAMPHLLHRNIMNSFISHINDVKPYIICPILVTTADLRIMNDIVSVKDIKDSKEIEGISRSVDYLKIYSLSGPGLENHCTKIFEELPEDHQMARFKYFKDLRKVEFNSEDDLINQKFYSDPETLIIGLSNGIINDLFSETLICSLNGFTKLLNQLKESVNMIVEGFEDIHR